MKKEIIITRVFNAHIELVWKTFTDPEFVKRWWGPDNFTCPSAKIDFIEALKKHDWKGNIRELKKAEAKIKADEIVRLRKNIWK